MRFTARTIKELATLPIQAVATSKFTTTDAVRRALAAGDLTPSPGGDQVAWDRAYEVWQPDVLPENLVSRVNALRLMSKTIRIGIPLGSVLQEARGHAQAMRTGFTIVPVNRKNADLMLSMQLGGHDGNYASEGLRFDTEKALIEGESVYQIRLLLSITDYQQGLHPAPLCALPRQLAKTHRMKPQMLLEKCHRLGVTYATLGEATLVFMDDTYQVWARSHGRGAEEPTLFTQGLLSA